MYFFVFYVNIDSDETFTMRKKRRINTDALPLLAFHVRTVALSAPFKPQIEVKRRGTKHDLQMPRLTPCLLLEDGWGKALNGLKMQL